MSFETAFKTTVGVLLGGTVFAAGAVLVSAGTVTMMKASMYMWNKWQTRSYSEFEAKYNTTVICINGDM